MPTPYPRIADWDAAYDNRAAAPDHPEIVEAWARDAAAFRTAHPPEVIAYGAGDRQKLDLFRPGAEPAGLLTVIHGGYWVRFGREWFSHLAAGALARGWAVALPSYTLCPKVGIGGITAEIALAVGAAASAVPEGPLVVSGHSAGGHLAAMMGCARGPLAPAARRRVKRIVGVSGLYDLRPLRRLALNAQLGLDAKTAPMLSPALRAPYEGFDVLALCGAAELPEFRRQNALLPALWAGFGVAGAAEEAAGAKHFDVIAPLTDPDSDLTRAATLARPVV